CTIFHGPTGELCANAEARLPNIAPSGNATCDAALAPGAAIEHYDIGLRLLDNVGAAGDETVIGCETVLRVNGLVAPIPGFDSRLIRQRATDATTIIVTRKVDFAPMSVAACPTSGLMCTGLVAPTNP